MSMKLSPGECVFRICRNCCKPMELTYEWDSDYRWYLFHCDVCGFDVSLGENITQEMRESNMETGDYPEPLTREEVSHQLSLQAKADAKRMHAIPEKDLNDLK